MKIWLTVITICFSIAVKAQEIDSLKKLLVVTDDGLNRINILENLSYAYLSLYPDTALKYASEGLQLAKKINHRKGEAICTNALGNAYFHLGDNAKALEFYLEYLKIKEELKDLDRISIAYYNIAGVYVEEQDYRHALFYLFKAKKEDEKTKDSSAILYDAYSLGTAYLRMLIHDSALLYIDQSFNLAKLLNDENMKGAILNTYGEAYLSLNDTTLAARYYHLSIPYAESTEDNEVLIANYYGLAKIFKQKSILDSAAGYGKRALNLAKEASFSKQVLEISEFLTGVFKDKKQFESAFYYQALSIAAKDSLFNVEELRKVQNLKFAEQQRQQSLETAQIKYRSKVKLFIVIFTSVILLIIAVLLWRNNNQKQKVNILLRQQKEEIQNTLTELKATQAQLIQSEKMASLGALTAGIAHEIQNPLNFVNNFSEVNKELIDELEHEAGEGNLIEIKAIAKDIKENEQKINQHGKRADEIVKAMLQHSQSSSGINEPTDINKLAEEYLQLAYHGFRTKSKAGKEFTATMRTDFDDTIGNINIIPQDIGKVLLNLYSNAFYAISDKHTSTGSALKEGKKYEPTVSVSTKKVDGRIFITVNDNGNGIPQKEVDKIFQPFFTTKPTGKGIGLGLSLAYDIIKAHGGEIKVESKEGEGAEFIIQLPLV